MIKTITFAITHFTVAFSVAYLLTGNIGISSTLALVEKTGTQGVELLMWLAMRAALGPQVNKVHSNYHIPISNTATGLLALETVD